MLDSQSAAFAERVWDYASRLGNNAPKIADDIMEAAFPLTCSQARQEGALRMLRTGVAGDLWQRVEPIVADLDAAQRDGLQLRHLPVLHHIAERRPDLLNRPASSLYADLQRRLAQAQTHARTRQGDPVADHPHQLAAWQDELVWADLLVIHLFAEMLEERDIVDRWFAQADADLADRTTEYGGLIRLKPPDDGSASRPGPVLYEPTVRRHANAYYPPATLILDGYTALAHYHFHAQRHDNRRHAGPSEGDLRVIGDRQQYNGLVLTFIDRDRLNIDYYQQGGVVVDLGTVYR